MGLLSGIDNFTGWALLQKNGPSIEAAYAANSSSATDIAYFKKIAPTLTTPDALLKNFRALTFVATAYGLASQVGQTAILHKLMTQDPTSTSSLAQQLADNRYRNFANALSNWSPPPFSTQAGINATITGYQQQSFDTSIGQDSTSLQEAQYFTQNAKGTTQLSQLMSDPAMVSVLTTALGIPSAAFGNLSYDQQVAILKPRVDMTQFATAAGVASFVNRYLAMDQVNQITAANNASSPLLALFSGNNNGGLGTPQLLTLSAGLFSSSGVNLVA